MNVRAYYRRERRCDCILDDMARSLIIIIVLLFAHVYLHDAAKTLKMVNLIYRHGARSPLRYYPNDPYQENFWPDGSGRLTQNGMRQEYNLGKFFKERYVTRTSLINQQYFHKEVFIQSSDTDRCIQSAQAQLAGLYPPTGYQVWNKDIPWQPIPIHSIPKKDDVLLHSTSVPCPRLEQLLYEKKESEVYKLKQLESRYLFKIISKYSGMNVDMSNLYFVMDPVTCEKAEGLQVPKWIDTIWKEAVALRDWWLFFRFGGDDEIGRLLGGSLLWKMNENMEKLAGNKDVEGLHKLNMWSGHDISIAALCAALDIKIKPPDFATSIMIELYRTSKMEYFVEILYRKDAKNDVERLKLKGCDYQCPLTEYLNLTKARTTMDRSKLCKNKASEDNHVKKITIVLLLLGCIFSFFIIALLILQGQKYFVRTKVDVSDDTKNLMEHIDEKL